MSLWAAVRRLYIPALAATFVQTAPGLPAKLLKSKARLLRYTFARNSRAETRTKQAQHAAAANGSERGSLYFEIKGTLDVLG